MTQTSPELHRAGFHDVDGHVEGQAPDYQAPDYQDREAIAARAYELWQRRGCPQGTALQDWCEAEAALRDERRARLEATRLFEPPTPVEIGPAAAAATLAATTLAENAPGDSPAKRRRRTPAAAKGDGATQAMPGASLGTRVTRKRPARPDA